MKLSEFIALDEQEKKQAVLHQAILLAKRQFDDTMCFLFQMDEGYYVEAYCDYSQKQVHTYLVSDNTQLLHPYLDAIPIGGL